MSSYIIQHCTTPHCDVAIRVSMGQQDQVPVCKWCLNNTAMYAVERQRQDAARRA